MTMTGVRPGWLGGLVGESFFVGCDAHESRKKNEKNIFCLGCCASICPHCTPSHHDHPLLQVRRYVYNDVVRLDDLEKLIDCSHVQPYTINSAKVIFLKPRPQSRPFKGSGNICLTCDRILQEPFHFCSLSCKVDHVMMQGEDLSSILYRFNESDFAFPNFDTLGVDVSDLIDDEDQQITPNSILEDPSYPFHHYTATHVSPSAPASSSGGGGGHSRRESSSKKKKPVATSSPSSSFLPSMIISLNNRRKGSPHRSPFI